MSVLFRNRRARFSERSVAGCGPFDEGMNRMLDSSTVLSQSVMNAFAERTGLVSGAQRRYLWTDAFAVCNFLGLAQRCADSHYDELALQLVNSVHHVLGRHREDEQRSGWLSGLPSDAGESHPTAGGLRIGKPLMERAPGQPLDPDMEWDRDGQYFHYLTKWMHALAQVARARSDPTFLVWAVELADVAHRRFTYGSGHHKRMYWKMSIDLTRPLVPSMGQHDPLDGLLTCLDLANDFARSSTSLKAPDLSNAIADFSGMIERDRLATSDPLGIGGLLIDAARLARLVHEGARGADPELLDALLVAAFHGLRHFNASSDLSSPANRRLAFRELGIAIGFAALETIDRDVMTVETRQLCKQLDGFARLRRDIETFWLLPENRAVRSWVDHSDINDVMLATSLSPHGFL
jgi:hypothetical protein